MSLKTSMALATAGAMLAAALSPAFAAQKHRWKHRPAHGYSRLHRPAYPVGRGYAARPVYPGAYAGGYGQKFYSEAPPGSAACVPMCRWDTNPCDPPYFKRMDGRCDPSEHGGF